MWRHKEKGSPKIMRDDKKVVVGEKERCWVTHAMSDTLLVILFSFNADIS